MNLRSGYPRPPLSARDGAGGSPAPAVAADETWHLDDLYRNVGEFRAARDAVEARLPDLEWHRGRLGRSADALAEALDRFSETRRELARLHAYALMSADEDTRNASLQAQREEIELLWTRFSRAGSFLRPEILAIDPERLDAMIDGAQALAPHRHWLRDLARQRRHILGEGEERVLAEAGMLRGGPHALFTLLHNAELPRPEVVLSDGRGVRLTPAAFARHRTTLVRSDRELLFHRYFSTYRDFRETLGQNVAQAIKNHVFQARVRDFDDCLHAALDSENIPIRVYHNLIDQVRARLPVLHRYFRLRARALGVERLAYHDIHCPLTEVPPRRYTPAEARLLVARALSPLGERYAERIECAFRERWIDWHPRAGKRAGAYMNGGAYDVHPFVLLNFHGDYESVSTLAHELGHAMHSDFSNRAQPYPTAGYSILGAEVASTLNEALLDEQMAADAESLEERLSLLASFLEGMRATLFRQVMFAEFELAVHARVERGEGLSGEALSEMYLDLLRAYHGHGAGVVDVAEDYAVEWAAIPHFYYDFYVYQYATGIVAATALAEGVLSGDVDRRERYLEFLSSGGSDYALALLARAGVDLERPEPYADAFRAVERRLDGLEELLDARDRGDGSS